jgi:hypothetical protein
MEMTMTMVSLRDRIVFDVTCEGSARRRAKANGMHLSKSGDHYRLIEKAGRIILNGVKLNKVLAFLNRGNNPSFRRASRH